MSKSKKEFLDERAIKHGLMFIEKDATIRSVTKKTSYSRSTIHNDLRRLESVHPELYKQVIEKINFNFSVKHLRGGYATQKKWEGKKSK